MSSHYLHKYYRGVLLPSIAYALGVPQAHIKKESARLHDAFKEYLCVNSTADFTSDSAYLTYMSTILMLMAREKGILVPFLNEPDYAQDMSMPDWLNLQKIIDK